MSEPAAPPSSVCPFDIGIVGSGIVGTHQFMREAEEVIRRSTHTFVVASGYGIPEYIQTMCPRVTDLGHLYEPGRDRLPTYHRMAAAVVSAAVVEAPSAWPPTATRGCTATRRRWSTALRRRSGCTLRCPGGVCVRHLARRPRHGHRRERHPDVRGHRPVAPPPPLQSDVACVLWQPTVVGDPTCPAGPYAREQFEPPREYLLGFYTPDHEVRLVTSKMHPLIRSTVRSLSVGELAAALAGAPGVEPCTYRPSRNDPSKTLRCWT